MSKLKNDRVDGLLRQSVNQLTRSVYGDTREGRCYYGVSSTGMGESMGIQGGDDAIMGCPLQAWVSLWGYKGGTMLLWGVLYRHG